MDYRLSWVTHILIIITIAGCQDDTQSNSTLCKNHNEICLEVSQCAKVMDIIKNNSQYPVNERKQIPGCGFNGTFPLVCCSENTESQIVFNTKSEEVATNRPRPSHTPVPNVNMNRRQYSTAVRTEPFSDNTVCGRIGIGNRIVGGVLALADDFPWLARIKYIKQSPSHDEHYPCAASLITNQYLISAAHCFVNNKSQPVSVRLGEWDTESPGGCESGICLDMPVEIEIDSVKVHQGYEPRTKIFADIALIRMKRPVNFTDYIQPICLPTSEYVKMQDYQRDSVFTAAGWGMTEFGSSSVIKRKVQLPSVPLDTCKIIIPSINDATPQALICAGGKKDQDTCMGDSGGPLMRAVSENYVANLYLYGITSVGSRNCGAEGAPGLYTRVTFFLDWIREGVKDGTLKT